MQCPGCAAKGGDNSKDNLSLFPDDESRGWCPVCQKAYNADGSKNSGGAQTRMKNTKDDSGELLSVIQTYPIKALHDGLVPVEIAEKYGVRCSVSEETGDIQKIYYPYKNPDGDVVGYKLRTIPKGFAVIGSVVGLFGQQEAKKGGRMLTIVEGEKDLTAVATMQAARNKTYNLVSLPNGASVSGVVDQVTRNELEFICAHELVVLFFDNDKAGQAMAKAMAELICSQSRVKIITTDRKDAFELLENGEEEKFWIALNTTSDFQPGGVVMGSKLDRAMLRLPKKKGYSLPYEGLQKKTQGLRKGEITTVTAAPGIGKSSFAREICLHLATKHSLRVVYVALETPYDEAIQYFIAMDQNISPWKLILNPKTLSDEKWDESFTKLFAGDDRLFAFDHWGSIDADDLANKFNYLAKALRADFICLDHLSLTTAGKDVDERKTLDTTMERLTKLVVETGVGIINIVHLRRSNAKSFNKGDEVELTDVRGTSGIEAMSWNLWALERDMQAEDGKQDIVKIRVLKSRLLGFTGIADHLIYQHDTGRLLPLQSGY